MKVLLSFAALMVSNISCAQVPTEEYWRYTNVYTSLFNYNTVAPFTMLSKDNIELTESELYAMQIANGSIKPDSTANTLSITISNDSDSTITGRLINGTKDTLVLKLNSGHYSDFTTEVKYKGKWKTFQINMPFACGMGIGRGKLFPHYYCDLTLEKTTKGKNKLPFRLKLVIDNKTITSNTIEITCSKEQLRLVDTKIKDFSW